MSAFDGVKVIQGSTFRERADLGERITEWLQSNQRAMVVDIVMTQSSDAEYHCITASIFYKVRRAGPVQSRMDERPDQPGGVPDRVRK